MNMCVHNAERYGTKKIIFLKLCYIVLYNGEELGDPIIHIFSHKPCTTTNGRRTVVGGRANRLFSEAILDGHKSGNRFNLMPQMSQQRENLANFTLCKTREYQRRKEGVFSDVHQHFRRIVDYRLTSTSKQRMLIVER
jgi:hypothetical protein